MLSLACGTPMHQYFWHLMKKPQKVTFPKRLLDIYYKIYTMDNIVFAMFKKYSGTYFKWSYSSFHTLCISGDNLHYSEESPPRICGLILLHYLGKYLGLVFHVS